MILLLGYKNDLLLHSLYQLLVETNDSKLLYPEDLIFAKKWIHTIERNGSVSTQITLPDNQVIDSKEISCVYNRIHYMQMEHFPNSTDRLYASAEFYALFLSFLKSVECKSINPIQTSSTMSGLSDNWTYRIKAMQVGIPITNEQFTSSSKWEKNPLLQAYEPKQLYGHTKKASYLLLTNQPALLKEDTERLFKAYYVNNTVLSPIKLPFLKQIKSVAKILKKDFAEFIFIQKNQQIKLKKINEYPLFVSIDILNALASAIVNISNANLIK